MMVHAYPNGGMIPADRQHTVENVGYAVRAAKEIGVDVIKTFYTGDGASFARIVAIATPCRLIDLPAAPSAPPCGSAST